ncbi:MAG: hypothetical protein U0401_22495 [Anaerolineae bacterium]
MPDISTTNGKSSPVLKVENVAIAYKVRGGEIEAVQDVYAENWARRGARHRGRVGLRQEYGGLGRA